MYARSEHFPEETECPPWFCKMFAGIELKCAFKFSSAKNNNKENNKEKNKIKNKENPLPITCLNASSMLKSLEPGKEKSINPQTDIQSPKNQHKPKKN